MTLNTERWEFRAITNDYRCRLHECEFERGEVCVECADEVTEPPSYEIGDESEHDRELARRESEWRQDVKFLRRRAREAIKNGDYGDGAKLFAEAAKLDRMAADNRDRRAARDHDRVLVRHRREMAGLRKSN